MLAFARLRFGIVAAAFAAACLCQPLALNACAVSCEAARAARTPAVAPPCHHTTSCATQVSQPTVPGAAAGAHALAPPPALIALDAPASSPLRHAVSVAATRSASPPLLVQLRL